MDQVIEIVVPLEGASGVKGKVDVTVHFDQGAGSMVTFREFIKRERAAGRVVTLRSSADEAYPIAEIEGEDYALCAFGPHFNTDDQAQRDLGESATEEKMALRIALDDAKADL